VKNFKAHSFFLGKHKLLKNPECEKYIQYDAVKNFRATLFLKASASYSKILNIKSIFNTCSENFQDNSFFQGKRNLLKSCTVKNFSIQRIFTWGLSV